MALDLKKFIPDSSWNPTGDAAIVGSKILLAALASYFDDFEGLSEDDPIPGWTVESAGSPTFTAKNLDSQMVAQLAGAGWISAYNNSNFGDGMLEAQITLTGANRYTLLTGRLDLAQRSGYMAAYNTAAAFWAATSGVDPGGAVWTDYPWYGDTDQVAAKYNGATLGYPMVLKHQIASLANNEVEHFMFVNDIFMGKHLDVEKKYPAGTKIKIGTSAFCTWGYLRFWPTKIGGFEKTFTPYSVSGANPWKRIFISTNTEASRSKRFSEYLEYRIDSGSWTPVPDDGDLSSAPSGASISVRANSTMKNDRDASNDVSLDSIAIEIEGEWDAPVGVPVAPTSIAANTNTNHSARVSWIDSVTSNVVYNKIYKNTVNDFGTSQLCGFSLQGTQYADIYGLDPSTQYWFWVVAVADDGQTSPPGGPDDTTTLASNIPIDTSAIQQVLYDWATRVTGGTAIFEYGDGPKPGKPFISINVIGPQKPGFTDSVKGVDTGDKDFEQFGDRVFNVSVNVYDNTDAINWASKLQASLDNPIEIGIFSEAGIGLGDAGDINDLTELLDTKYERRAQFDFAIFVASNIPFTGEVIETVDYQNNL